MASGKREEPPSRGDLEQKLVDLIENRISRRAVSDWAAEWVRMSDPPIRDERVWRALVQLSGADLPATDRQFLHDEVDFRAWLDELRKGRPGS